MTRGQSVLKGRDEMHDARQHITQRYCYLFYYVCTSIGPSRPRINHVASQRARGRLSHWLAIEGAGGPTTCTDIKRRREGEQHHRDP